MGETGGADGVRDSESSFLSLSLDSSAAALWESEHRLTLVSPGLVLEK